MRIIAGDVGGTKVLLSARATVPGAGSVERRYESANYSTFDDLLAAFVAEVPGPIDAACFAVAGPVLNGQAEITNLSWVMREADLARKFDIGRVSLINDFHAVALGVPLLEAGDLLSLNAGKRDRTAPIGIVGAGTGLGEAIVTYDGTYWDVIASEGGHADFAPQDEEQARLFLALREKYGHVSWERLLSGMGLVNIHNFLAGEQREYDETFPPFVAKSAAEGDATAVRTFEIFVDIYGAEAGNMALRVLARGGVFLAGGIASKNTSWFTDGRFLRSFLRKGRFHELLADIPVDLITNAKVGLIGAGAMAERLLK